jgi:NhaA family Na+:H+ antiporter
LGVVALSWIIKYKGGYNAFLFAGMGTLSWFAFSASGIHPTIAGVLMAITIPATKKVLNENQQKTHKKSPLDILEHALHPVSSFVIMPVFAFANAGIKIDSNMLSTLSDPVTIGIILGLWVGKPLGVFGSVWIVIKLKAAALPTGSSWKHIMGMSFLGGMGFTLSLFIAVLAFEDVVLLNHAKTGILLGSIVSVVSGILFFLKADPTKEATGSFK